MVTRRVIDCTNATSKEALHQYLKEVLHLPDYYGGNLDALFDCLTEIGSPTCLILQNTQRLIPLGDYGEALLSTFRDAALENPNVTLEEPFD